MMSLGLQDYQVSIGGVVMGPGTNYLIHDYQGLGITSVNTQDVARPNSDGTFLGLDTRGGHTVTIPMTIRGVDPATTLANYDALLAQWWLAPGQTCVLTFKLPGRPEQQLTGRPREFPADLSRVLGRRIMVQASFFAPSAIVESSDTASVIVSLPSSTASGRSYPKTYAYSYGAGTSGDGIVTNTGNYTTYPTFVIYGPVLNPYIQNATTGELIAFQINLGVGDFLTVDCYNRTVFLNGPTASRRGTVVPGSAWPSLPPGVACDYKFGGTATSGSPYAIVGWRHAWAG